ncbi:AtuA-related protein, partial [Micromonospora echinofusca]|nr:exopolyphosphatase [Micromonospora echinofusca]
AGRAFSAAAVELALASYPGCTLTTLPGDATPYGVFTADTVPQSAVEHVAVLPSGGRVTVPPPQRCLEGPLPLPDPITGGPSQHLSGQRDAPGEVVRGPLGTVVGARSGDKGGDANLGVWARTDDGYAWLRDWLTVDRVRELLPETALLPVERYDLPNLRAVNLVVRGLLGQGVAASTRFDPQAKALGELLRARIVDLPAELVPEPAGGQR